MNKTELYNKIVQLDGLTNEEKSELLGLLRKQKKYGLVWEDKPEDVEERLRDELPVLIEDAMKAIISDDANAPNHILIEGDNLEALTSLAYTHEGKIDVIYIDPPYNTGNKVLAIYALSIDYDPRAEATQLFFKTVQNKMHFSAHGHTAAEVIYERADAEKDFMGLTSWTGAMPKRTDAEVAKNYLSADELDTLNRIVSLYLDFAELQAKSHQPMYMKDWIQKLDDFLKLSGKELLTHAGRISAEIAKQKADMEYDKFKERTMYELSPVEIHFLENFEKEQKKLKE